MGKLVKRIVVGIVIVVATVYTAGAINPGLFAGATFGGLTGTAAAAASGALLTSISTGLSAIAQRFTRKEPGDLTDSQRRLNTQLDVNAPGKWIFGKTAGALDLVYADKSSGNRYISQVLHVASHEIESFEELYVNDELAINSAGVVQSGWTSVIRRLTAKGTTSQTAINSSNSSWPSSARGRGMAHMLIEWDFEGGQDKLSNQIPRRLTQIVKGAPVYDPRLDTTVGGSGTHRANDQTTWQYNDGTTDIGENAALIFLFGLLGWHENGVLKFGMGESPSNIDYDSFIAMANVAEQTVDGKKKYSLGGIMPTDQNHERIFNQLESTTGGKLGKVGGKWFLWLPHDDLTSLGTINESDMVRQLGQNFIPSGPIEDLFNTARGRYIEPDELYQPQEYPEVVESSAVTEDGKERALSKDFSFIQDPGIAERMAREQIRRSRFSAAWQFTVGPMGLQYLPFDVITINSIDTNNTDQLVRIVSMSYSPLGIVEMEVIEEDSSIYDVTDALGTPVTQNEPDALDSTTKYSVTTLVATATALLGSNNTASDGFKVTWDDPGNFVKQTEVQFKISSTSDWQEVPQRRVGIENAMIHQLEPGTDYDIRARHISITDVIGDWNTITNQTAGNQDKAGNTRNVNDRSAEDVADRVMTPPELTGRWRMDAHGLGGYEPNPRNLVSLFIGPDAGTRTMNPDDGTLESGTRFDDKRVVNDINFSLLPMNMPGRFRMDAQGLGGYEAEPRVVVDVTGGSDGGTVVIDALNRRVKGTTLIGDSGSVQGSWIEDSFVGNAQMVATIASDDGGGTVRQMTKGLSIGFARDGDSVTFAQAWDGIPKVVPFPGGVSFKNSGLTGDQTQNFEAINKSTTGFDMKAKIQELAGTTTTRTDSTVSSPSSPSGLDHSINKGTSAEAYNDQYEYQFDVTIQNGNDPEIGFFPGSVTVGFYTNDGSGWVKRATETYNGSAGSSSTTLSNQTKTITADGLGLNDDFGINIESEFVPGGSLNFDQVQYETASQTSVTATPTGANDVPFFVLGG